MPPPALVIKRSAVEKDVALRMRGTRKIVVTRLYGESEELTENPVWDPGPASAKCPVLVTDNLEICVFDETARQDRHYHKIGTEIYMVMEGSMDIEVEGGTYSLDAGDMIVVAAGARHQVHSGGHRFLSRVIVANCGGAGDKFPA